MKGRDTAQPRNVVFWGAGATAALGICTTDGQTQFIKRFTGADAPGKPLKERVAEALGRNGAEQCPPIEPMWLRLFTNLITALYREIQKCALSG